MNFDLLRLLSRFRPYNDVENQTASFRTLVPWVGPEAYLNIVYRGASSGLLSDVARKLRFPETVVEALRHHNGAKLFSGALNLYGVVEPGHLLNRQDSFSIPPFNIEDANKSLQVDPERLLVVGGYQFDGSRACIDRSSGRILLFRKKQVNPGVSWQNLESWLTQEVSRICLLFDDDGKRLSAAAETVPRSPLE